MKEISKGYIFWWTAIVISVNIVADFYNLIYPVKYSQSYFYYQYFETTLHYLFVLAIANLVGLCKANITAILAFIGLQFVNIIIIYFNICNIVAVKFWYLIALFALLGVLAWIKFKENKNG